MSFVDTLLICSSARKIIFFFLQEILKGRLFLLDHMNKQTILLLGRLTKKYIDI